MLQIEKMCNLYQALNENNQRACCIKNEEYTDNKKLGEVDKIASNCQKYYQKNKKNIQKKLNYFDIFS